MSDELACVLRGIVQKMEEIDTLKRALWKCLPRTTEVQRRHTTHITGLLLTKNKALSLDKQRLKELFNTFRDGVETVEQWEVVGGGTSLDLADGRENVEGNAFHLSQVEVDDEWIYVEEGIAESEILD